MMATDAEITPELLAALAREGGVKVAILFSVVDAIVSLNGYVGTLME